ncbi:T-cell surface glycoprotein CD8 beta chain isoform 1-T1 [Acanthopagrus schlegelii]
MIPLPLAWTLLTVYLWTPVLGSNLILHQEPPTVLYPKILSTESIECDCGNISCEYVYWFRSISDHSEVQFLGKWNNAGRAHYGEGVDEARFKVYRRNSMSFPLRIINVTEKDAGIYSCVLKDKKNTEMWKTGILLRPGVVPPTLPPKVVPKRRPPTCRCTKNSKQEGCGSLILWPLVGLIAALAVALICILYYFSRLPKKCRHHFVKKRRMT